MDKRKILGTGLQGLIGSRIVDLLSSHYTFENISRTMGVDITKRIDVTKAIEQSEAEIVLHVAAKSDVDGSEKEKDLGTQSEAWKINVEGTENVALACAQFGKKMIYISTDFVFDGEKEFYTEEDVPSPINWYATTKYEGEKIVQALRTPWIIARIAYPYRAAFQKSDFVRAIKNRLANTQEISMITDHIMTPTFIDDIVYALDTLIRKQENGIFHVCGSEFVSPYDAALVVAEIFHYDASLILKTTRADFFHDKAKRPYRLALKNDKIRQLGVEMSTLTFGLEKLKEQL